MNDTKTNKCLQNSKLWNILNKMKIANNNQEVVLTSEQRYTLCNYIQGKPFNKIILQSIFKK